MDIRQYGISSFIKPQGHRHSYREPVQRNIFGVYALAKLLNYRQRPGTRSDHILQRCLRHADEFGAAIIVRKLETFSPRRAGQGVSDPGA